ncbi:Kelch repeat and BTB domain-containing protein 1 [Pyrenophora tritici-repentis]|nr:Kelch repeat and BTB domain-containing protein 1 [Pyrenophora tritici-repentis]KAI0610478.1 Kelch repeat and BTB domain-containing protein 1 [Pyrenophora tritici-repentis]KAI0617540.1 Kelch repeat and BTB domain-containing protein 1 [Pyrenophora tritici-repentis]
MVSTCPPHILRAYKNGDFTDLVISCGGSEFAVHSVVVGSACEFFAKSLKFPGKEAEKRRIDLQEDDPEMIRRLVAYLYVGDYDPSHKVGIKAFGNIKQHKSDTEAALTYHPRNLQLKDAEHLKCACLAPNLTKIEQLVFSIGTPELALTSSIGETICKGIQVKEPLTIHATMYALADKYQVAGLGGVAKAKFEETLHHHSNSVDFINAVQIAYSSTPDSNRGLRDTVVRAFRVHFQVNVAEIPGLEAKLETIDKLSFLLIKSWPKKTEPAQSGYAGLFGSSASSERKSATPVPSLFGTMPRPPVTGGLAASAPLFTASTTNTR